MIGKLALSKHTIPAATTRVPARQGGPEVSSTQETVLVGGAGGFIGGHLARTLVEKGYKVRGADVKPLDEWYQIPDGVETVQLDLAKLDHAQEAVRGVDTVYMLAADM